MLILLQGWGSVVGLLGAGLIAWVFQAMGAPEAIGLVVAGAALTVFGYLLNDADGSRHRIFWVPIQWWGLLTVGAAFVAVA